MRLEVKFPTFKKYVLQASEQLLSMGYSLTEAEDRAMIVKYEKSLSEGCTALVIFQYNWDYMPPEQTFKVSLRRHSPKETPRESLCPTLIFLLFKLLILKYHIPQAELKVNHKGWVYRNRRELKTQMETAMQYLLHYGIPWLEDPASNMDEFKPRAQ